ncbi:predicted protein [Uncinocarpus reesii 1704]|uniref:Alpha-galactosidase A n=1 Tax=Uncinocarpus reesii (strain UAMH 1704) TaxID=336963 RepID=C4JPH1_UNCRE|nr:uncharacterized protein UREG_03143 [Uncinocarpus reesii 1704]EEP78297.1 predicted protein [Uncinocarpus reesii 1704]
MKQSSPTKVELLQAELDDDSESFVRLLVDGKLIKYVIIAPGLFSVEDMAFGPSLITLLPPFPQRDWNEGLVEKDPHTGNPHFARYTRKEFPGVKHLWHGRFVDYIDLKIGKKLTSGVYEVTSSKLDKAAVAKFARFDWEIQYMENETTAYEWIQGSGVGPEFLGHITEEGRVIGFLIERIDYSHRVGPGDLTACQNALAKLHSLGIMHGDVNRYNFLILAGGETATLIDFETARKCDDEDLLRKEFEELLESLLDMSGRGKGCLPAVN